MRFIENGPIIPNDLLDARDEGDVVFICGAGISIPAGLPDFFKLTSQVAESLGVQPDSELGVLIAAERQRRATKNVSNLIGSLPFDRIFTALVRLYGRTQVESEVGKALVPRKRAKLDHHRALLDLARGPDRRQRLITTNFDRLFRAAQPRLRTYSSPQFPDLSRRDGFDGVVHLHGQIARQNRKISEEPIGLILTSGDFGRAYLAEAWATRFICDLLDRHIVVLLGYSADDPPVRYLLEGLSLSGRIRESRLFAFAAGETAQIESEWRERGVTAIPYDSTDNHVRLWESIHAWAERARDPVTWQNKIVSLASTPPRELKPFERGQVAALCSSAEGATAFASAAQPPRAEWLCVFDATCRYWKAGRTFTYGATTPPEVDPLTEYGLDDDPPRPQDRNYAPPGLNLLAPLKSDDPAARELGTVIGNLRYTTPLNGRLFQIARWIRAVFSSSTTVWWAASRPRLHPHLHDQISWALDTENADIDPIVRKAWRIVLEARECTVDEPANGWWTVQSQIKKEGWTSRTLREFASATKPRLTAQRPWHYAPVPPEHDSPLTLSRIAHIEVLYPKLLENISDIPDSSLARVIEATRRNLELGATLEEEISQAGLKLPTLHPEHKPGEHHYTESEAYYVMFANLFRRLSAFDVTAAQKEYQEWHSSARFFVPLRIWALADPNVATPDEVGRALSALDRDTFWDSGHRRELLSTIRARWASLSIADQLSLEDKIVEGRAKFDLETDTEYAERRASLSAERLIWMVNAGLQLSPATTARIPTLKKTNPHWHDSWADNADDSNDSRFGWVRHDTAPTPIANLPVSEVIARCDELAKREFLSFTNRDPFHGLIEAAPQRAMAVLAYEARHHRYPERYWSELFSAWPKTATLKRIILLAETISELPLTLLVSVRFGVCRWASVHFQKIDRINRRVAWRSFDRILESLEKGDPEILKSGLGKTSVGGVEIPSNRMGVDYAINSPTGDLAQALMNTLFARKLKVKQKLPNDIRQRIERLLGLPDEGGSHALTIVAQQVHGIYAIDPGWAKTSLLPRFDPALPSAEAAWSGLLSSARMPAPVLFKELKKFFFDAIAASSRWTCDGLNHLGQVLILALESPPRRRPLVSSKEARNALREASSAIRLEALFFLRNRIGQPHAWEKLIGPFFTKVWPRERKFQTPETTGTLVLFLEDLGPRFPDGVDLVANYLVPTPRVDTFVFQFGSSADHGRANLTTQYPGATLTVLDKTIDEKLQHAPYGLANVLTKLVDAAPDLRHDERWQRLHRMTLV